jgi:hypothetical protein
MDDPRFTRAQHELRKKLGTQNSLTAGAKIVAERIAAERERRRAV